MKRRAPLPLAFLLAACASSTPAPPSAPRPEQPRPGLAAYLQPYVSGSAAGLAGLELGDPTAFFSAAFGPEKGARLAAGYAAMRPHLSAEAFARDVGPPARERALSVVHVDPVVRAPGTPELW